MWGLFRRRFLKMNALGLLLGINGSEIAGAKALEGDSFKQEVIEILRRHHPDWVREFLLKDNDDPMLIEIGDYRVSLDSIFLLVQPMTGNEREEAILDFLEAALADPQGPEPAETPYEEAKDRLRPQILPAEYKDQVPSLISRPFFSGLHVGYALDEEKRYALMLEPVLTAWHISQEKLEAQAISNLEALVAQQELVPKMGEKGSYLFLAADDSFGAARLLLPDFMARVRMTLNAPMVFIGIPDRDFAIAWTPDFSGRQGFADKIQRDLASEPYPLTDELFASSDKGLRLMTLEEKRDHGRWTH